MNIAFLKSVFIVLFGLSASFKANMNQRKKDRMDLYYQELLDLKDNLEDTSTKDLSDNLKRMQKIVFDLLIKEKLSANNEFVIFMMLWDELHHELMKRQGAKI